MPTINDARIRFANEKPIHDGGKYVLFWLQMARRLSRNHALDYAIHLAGSLKKPLVIYEGLKLNPPWANARFHTFLLEGMRDNAAAANALGATYWPFVETPGNTGRGLVRKIAKDACAIITDDYPAYIVPAQIRRVASAVDCRVVAVDTNSIVPLSLLGKAVSAAAHIRPRIHKLFPDCWPHRANKEPELPNVSKSQIDPPFKAWVIPEDIRAFVKSLPLDQSVPAVNIVGGAVAGEEHLSMFLRRKLARYGAERNDPDDPEANAASGLSPWLHYGHLSIETVIEKTLATNPGWSLDEINGKTRNKDDYYCRDASINSFLDEAVTWRDLGHHWHHCRNTAIGLNADTQFVTWDTDDPHFNFETMDFTPRKRGTLEAMLPAWAWKTLSEHATDRREHVYTLDEFERSKTHDPLWNAAQTELVLTGKIHNYLRMLWAKKVLEWSDSPEAAYNILEHLNNKYAIDGRDPNSYTGILWCFGLFDRPWAPERKIFGNIRYMSSDNTARKFKLKGYYDYIARLKGRSLF